MAISRNKRVSEEIKKVVSHLIQHELKDPRIGFTSITDVETTRDLQHAKIFISVLGSEEEKEATIKALENAAGYIRSVIGQKVRLRHTPEILFRLDNSIERGSRVLEILQEVKDEEQEDHS